MYDRLPSQKIKRGDPLFFAKILDKEYNK